MDYIEEMQAVCCVCNKWRIGEVWLDPGESRTSKRRTHGYCPECEEKTKVEIAQYKKAKRRQAISE